MIVYNDILGKLSAAGWSTYRLQREGLISNGSIIQIRTNKPITTTTLNVICGLLSCQPGDLISWVPDTKARE